MKLEMYHLISLRITLKKRTLGEHAQHVGAKFWWYHKEKDSSGSCFSRKKRRYSQTKKKDWKGTKLSRKNDPIFKEKYFRKTTSQRIRLKKAASPGKQT